MSFLCGRYRKNKITVCFLEAVVREVTDRPARIVLCEEAAPIMLFTFWAAKTRRGQYRKE